MAIFYIEVKIFVKLIFNDNGYVSDFLIGRKHSRKDGPDKVEFRKLKAQIFWLTTDQKVRVSNPCGRAS